MKPAPPPAAAPASRSFWRYLIRPAHVVLIVSVMVTVQFLEHWGWLDAPSAALLDSFYILTQGDEASRVVIVEITEDDYRQVFHETSPLDPRLLSQLMKTIAVFRPSAIGVDIDTSASAFDGIEPRAEGVAVVWAVGARPGHDLTGGSSDPAAAGVLNPLHREEPELVLDPVLGRAWTDSVPAGLSVFALDSDNTVRRYSRSYRVVAPNGQPRTMETLPAVLCRASSDTRSTAPAHAERPVLIRFPRATVVAPRIPASFVLHAASEHAKNPEQPWPKLMDRFRDHVVLMGGTYGAARDSFATPRGRMSGVDLMAAAVETELAGGGINDTQRAAMVVLDLGLAVLLIYFGFTLRIGLMLAGGIGVVAVATAVSLFAFSSGLVWMNTIPLLVAVLLHQWGHRMSESRHRQARSTDRANTMPAARSRSRVPHRPGRKR